MSIATEQKQSNGSLEIGYSITSETDPRTIPTVGGAILYVLRYHGLKSNLRDIVNNTVNTEPLSASHLSSIMKDKTWPDSISQLVPNYLKEIPIDSYSRLFDQVGKVSRIYRKN